MSATIPEAAVPETAATSGANLVNQQRLPTKALRENQDNGCAEEGATACEIAGRLRTRDKSCDGVIESEDRNLARQISIRPGNRKRSQSSGSEKSRHEKGKDAAEVRRQHRDSVQERAAF